MAEAAPGIPILLQDHANRPPRWWRRSAWKRCARTIAGIAFCHAATGPPLHRGRRACAAAPRCTRFPSPPADSCRPTGRRRVGMPASRAIRSLLWVGHLDGNKDPLTVLDGIAAAAARAARHAAVVLFRQGATAAPGPATNCFGSASGRAGSPPGAGAPCADRAVDAGGGFIHFRQPSGVDGYALIEALACGLPPLVTDIPSFRALTGDGAVGQLWRPGDAPSLCSALLRMTARATPADRAAVRAHFERELSFEALGRKLTAIYGRRGGAG